MSLLDRHESSGGNGWRNTLLMRASCLQIFHGTSICCVISGFLGIGTDSGLFVFTQNERVRRVKQVVARKVCRTRGLRSGAVSGESRLLSRTGDCVTLHLRTVKLSISSNVLPWLLMAGIRRCWMFNA